MAKSLFLLVVILIATSCSDATKGSFSALGKSRIVKCYSGGVEIYSGITTGKIENESHSDGYFFTDTNGEYIEINANCIFKIKE
jgi:hypothetical protein